MKEGERLDGRAWLALLLPWFFAALFIAKLSVPMLLWDEWDAFGEFWLQTHAQGLSWSALWQPHNEHRIVIARLLFYLVCSRDLNPMPLILMSHIILGVTFWNLIPLLRNSGEKIPFEARPVFYFAFSALFFSGVQYENMIWGLQIGWSCVLFGIVLTIRGLVESSWWRIGCGLAVAYFSYAHWVVMVPLLVFYYGLRWKELRRQPGSGGRLATWLALTAGLVGLLGYYLHNLPHPEHHPSLLYAMTHPGQAFNYWMRYLGNPFYIPPWPEMSGIVCMVAGVCFLIGSLWAIRHSWGKADAESAWTLWTLAAVFGVSMLITLGRSGLGLHSATWSRYTTFMLLGLMVLLCGILRTFSSHYLTRLVVLGIPAVVAVLGLGYLHSQATRFVPARRAALACLSASLRNPSLFAANEACLVPLYPNPQRLFELATQLQNAGALPQLHHE